MPEKKQDNPLVVSVRLPHELVRRLDRYLDWSVDYQRGKSSRNAAIREALSHWLDDQEERAGFLDPQAQCDQFQAAYRTLANRHDWVAIAQLRHLIPWPRERFDAVVERLRADHQVDLERAEPSEMSDSDISDCYQVYGQLYRRLRWRP